MAPGCTGPRAGARALVFSDTRARGVEHVRDTGGVADAVFEDPRLARLDDLLEAQRRDLDAYVAVVAELGAGSVLDVGCGTGTLACRLARQGIDVIGVDPAAARSCTRLRRVSAWLYGVSSVSLVLGATFAFLL